MRHGSALAALVVLMIAPASRADEATTCLDGPSIPITTPTCGTLAPPTLSCRVPTDVQGKLAQDNANTIQRATNLFSWQQFIALNWPAAVGKRGEPAKQSPISAPGARVWETWKEGYEVYLGDGHAPAPWDTAQAIPAVCRDTRKLLMRSAKVDDVVDETVQASPANGSLPASLKDQQGRLVRYEIRLNRILFDYIVSNRLYDGRVQAKTTRVQSPPGSQLIKAAWREIDGDDADYFLGTDACVCQDDGNNQPTACRVQRMGLTGLHLMTKTESAPQWIWSTFEQVDTIVAQHPAVQPLNDPDCDATRCPPNRQTPGNVPTQLTRVTPIPDRDPDCAQPQFAIDNVVALNAELRGALHSAGTALSNYQLLNTQWPISGAGIGTVFSPLPTVLANTTMESFTQATSSCMGCHAMSRTLDPDVYVSADFSFTLNNALPRPPGAFCESVEASESCIGDLLSPPPPIPPGSTLMSEVQHGYDITRRTYELVNKPGEPRYVGNLLHCQSCHLHAGRDPEAAWWAGSEARYGGLEGLQQRINQCFAHSMNGIPLCEPGAQCDSNTDMRGLIAYIRWLTAQYERRHPGVTPTHGFPAIGAAPVTPDADRGAATYAQKCAFCHDAAGQGRYEGGYFRPALWGPQSFNALAGLAKVDALAAFLKANMPYTSGGMLSVQEAWDLATFIDAQERPPGSTAAAAQ